MIKKELERVLRKQQGKLTTDKGCSSEKYCHKAEENCNQEWYIIINEKNEAVNHLYKTKVHRRDPRAQGRFFETAK